jgi:hypothetical protein
MRLRGTVCRVAPGPHAATGHGGSGPSLRAAVQAAGWLQHRASQGRQPTTAGQARRRGPAAVGAASRPVRRRVRAGVFDTVGWRSGDRRGRGAVASRPRGPPDGGPGTTGPGSLGWWGRHGASGADGGPRTRPGAVGSRRTHSRHRGWPGRCAGRGGRPGWCGRPPAAGWGGTAKGRGQQRQRRRPEPVHPVLVLVAQLLQLAPVSGQRLLLGVGVVLVGPVAGDHHPGHRPITSQPPARLRLQRTHPTDLPAERAGVAEEAVQVDGDGQLGAGLRRSGGAGRLPGCGGPAR